MACGFQVSRARAGHHAPQRRGAPVHAGSREVSTRDDSEESPRSVSEESLRLVRRVIHRALGKRRSTPLTAVSRPIALAPALSLRAFDEPTVWRARPVSGSCGPLPEPRVSIAAAGSPHRCGLRPPSRVIDTTGRSWTTPDSARPAFLLAPCRAGAPFPRRRSVEVPGSHGLAERRTRGRRPGERRFRVARLSSLPG